MDFPRGGKEEIFMVRSMTGFGRGEAREGGITVNAEIKSVNHRFLEFSLRCPRSCQFLEDTLKKTVQSRVVRGKVDLSLNVTFEEGEKEEIVLNRAVAASYVNALRELSSDFKLKNDVRVSTLASLPDLFTVRKQEIDEELLTRVVVAAVNGALDVFIAMRETEGEALKTDVLSRADTVLDRVALVEQRSPETVREYSERLTAKINELLGDHTVEEQRILTEVALYADKVAVAEETVRLRSHIDQLHTLFDAEGETGRKLDFLVQEMNREANTIGSKAQDVTIARAVVDIKAEIEKIREQIQNIE